MSPSHLNAQERAVLSAFLQLAASERAETYFHDLVVKARQPPDDVTRALTRLRAMGYLTELRKYGVGRRLARITTKAYDARG